MNPTAFRPTTFRPAVAAAALTLLLAGCAITPPVTSVAPVAPVSPAATPAPAPTSATPQPGGPPAATPTGTARADTIPGTKGSFGRTIKLLHEGVKATSETSAWAPETWHPGGCPTDALKRAMGSVTASRVIGMTGPEVGFTEGLLKFPSDAEASAFLAAMAASSGKGCVTTQAADGSNRDLYNNAPASIGDEGLAVSSWLEMQDLGRWREVPGGGLTLLARKGAYVAISAYGGESVGDSSRPNTETRAEWHAELRKAIDHVLKQVA